MPQSGHGEKTLIAERAIIVLAWFCAIAPMFVMRGFTVDDAWIPLRYARHIAEGAGYTWNAGSAPTDGVTPLPWAVLLAPLSKGDEIGALIHVKYIETVAWAIASFAWAYRVGRADAQRWAKIGAALGMLVALPVAAHAASGLETGVVLCIVTAASIVRARGAIVLASLAAAFRPELAPWAIVFASGTWAIEGTRPASTSARAFIGALAGAAGFVAVALTRVAIFGHAAPLAVSAKPSDLSHGVLYAAAAALVSVGPIACFAPRAFARERGRGAVLVAAGVAHVLAVIAAGGDWMPYARLFAPIIPSLLFAAVLVSKHAAPKIQAARFVLAIALGAYTFVRAAPAGTHVLDRERSLIVSARPVLAGSRVVASVDIGWAGAATDARIVDLAGLTDPEIAALPGGHTSKRVDVAMLLSRDVDTVLLYSASGGETGDAWGRVTEARVAESPLFLGHFTRDAFLPFGDAGAGYAVFRRTP